MKTNELISALEAVLFASGEPISIDRLSGVFEISPEKTENVGPTETWGLGMRVITADQSDTQPMPKGCFGWSGAYGTHFWVDPANKLTAVFLKNTTTDGGSGASTSREFERDVYSALSKR